MENEVDIEVVKIETVLYLGKEDLNLMTVVLIVERVVTGTYCCLKMLLIFVDNFEPLSDVIVIPYFLPRGI